MNRLYSYVSTMKIKTWALALHWLLVLTPAFAQPLAGAFSAIAAGNDMMGGSLVVFCKNGVLENLAVGKSDLTRNLQATTETKYRIASISKVITAIAIMQLAEQGQLDLDADIGTILGYPVRNPYKPTVAITARMLLSHTSTIIDGPTYDNFLSATVQNNPIPNLSEILTPSGLYYTTGQFNNALPGHYFNYANINYVILGTIIEKASDLRFDLYCKQHITTPLGLDASFNVTDLSDLNQLAVLYRKIGGVWTPQTDNFQGNPPVYANLSGYVPGTNGGRFGPQGGLRCSAHDLAKIMMVLMNEGAIDNQSALLTPASCTAMLADEWTYNGLNGNNYSGLFRSWGLGIHRVTYSPNSDVALPGSAAMFGHAGEAYGLVSDAYFDLSREIGFVFVTNGVGAGYQTNNQSAFYTIEQEVFNAVADYGNLDACAPPVSAYQPGATEPFSYPNPVVGYLDLSGILPENERVVQIRSIDGRLLNTVYLEKGATTLDVQNLSNGMYILNAQGKSYRFVVMNKR